MNKQFNDLAIILSWPEATIRGDEKWMMFFKKIGIVKNLNFKVGHTGIVIIDQEDGTLLFYDFGRYIAPRGHGRARSKDSDPLLKIDIKAVLKDGNIQNLEEIITFLEELKPAMYGEGKLFFSIVHDINFQEAKKYGDACVLEGTHPYGAVARGHNNCSRFITRMLMKASKKFHYWHPINLPETIKASPISNLANSTSDGCIYTYTAEEGLKKMKLNRVGSFKLLVDFLTENVFTKTANLLPPDNIIGAMQQKSKTINIPKNSVYLGGVGDGAWYHIEALENNLMTIKRFTTQGKLEYEVLGQTPHYFDTEKSFSITYDSHFLFTCILQNGKKIKIKHVMNTEVSELGFKSILEKKSLKQDAS